MTNSSRPALFPVPQDAVEQGLLAAVGQDIANWVALESAGIGSEDFTNNREVFLFVQNYLVQYGKLPSSSQISTRFDWRPPIGDFSYWFHEMRRYTMARKILEVVQEGYQQVAEPEKALGYLLENLSLIRAAQNNHVQATDNEAAARLEKYRARQEYLFKGEKLLGLPTGMKIFDNTKVGWLPGSLIGCYARPSVGKTWWLLWQGALSWMQGETVLAITPEMPATQLSLRVDVLLCQMLGFPIDYNRLLIGDPTVQPNYEKGTAVLQESKRWWTYDSYEDKPVGLAEIASLIRQHNPGIVLIDGISLLRSDRKGGQTWEQVKDLCYGLKSLATVTEKPILITHQSVNRNRGKATEVAAGGRGDDFIMPSLSDSAFGDAFVQACSDIITMCGDKNTTYVTWYSVRKARERGWQEKLPPRMALATDFGFGRIIDLGELGWDEAAVGNEVKKLFNLQRIA